jgi:hypothetical protein
MKNIYRKFLSIILLALVAVGCDDKLDIKPAQSLSTDVAISDFAGLSAAIYGAYDGLQSVNYYGRDFVVFPEVRGDNVYLALANSNRFVTDYNYQINALSTQLGLWNVGYAVILRVNNIIAEASKVSDAPQVDIDQIVGEAYAIRALVHFDLVRTFGVPFGDDNGAGLGVPIKLTSELTEPSRNTVAEVYEQVISDLAQAKTLMTQDVGPYRITDVAADALLARVYLYKGDNANAEASASAVIANTDFSFETDFETLWTTSGTTEEIFTVRRVAAETLGSDNLGQIFNPSGYGDIRVTQDIRDMYEDGDARIDLYYLHTNNEWYVGKYLGEGSIPGLASTKVLRLPEMYLIRAEARAKQNKFALAIDDIDEIRDRAGLDPLGAIADGDVLEEVLNERRRELAFEGHRSFDLYRNGLPLERIQCNSGLEITTLSCVVEEDSHLRIYPIPQRELDVNQNMVQTTGYSN